ncbi:hypothetical protein D3C80_1502240 [compost metagenome]
MRLGQAHGTRPAAFVHVRQVLGLELLAAVVEHRQAGAGGQHRIEGEGQVGRVDHLLDLGTDRLGHAHAAEVGRTAHADPAAFAVGLVGRGEASRGLHGAIVPGAAFLVAAAVQRGNHSCGDLAGLLEDGARGVDVDDLGQRRQVGPQLGNFEDFIEDEVHVTEGRFVVRHWEHSTYFLL